MEKNELWGKTQLNIAAALLLILGIGFMMHTFQYMRNVMQEEHRSHVKEMAWSIDHNLSGMMKRAEDELRFAAKHAVEDELAYLEDGNREALREHMHGVTELGDNCVEMMLLVRDGVVLECAECGEDCDFSFPLGWNPKEPCLCEDNRSRISYLAVTVPSVNKNGLYYCALLNLRELYTRVASRELPTEYWVVLYNGENGLVLQTDNWQPAYFEMDYKTAMARGDGIAVTAESERTQLIGSDIYSFTYPDGSTIRYLIVSIPSVRNENGVFAVGVAVDCEQYLATHRRIIFSVLLAALLFCAGAAVLLLSVYRTQRARRRTETHMKRLQEENRTLEAEAHRQRLALIGTMTSSISHEFNNLLTPIMGDSLLSMELLPEGSEDVMENLTEIYQASSRAKELISQIARLSRINYQKNFKAVSPDTLVLQAVRAAKPSLPPFVETRTDLRCENVTFRADETQITQLLLNLILNAYQAMEGVGGTLMISTRLNGNRVELLLSDTGPGMPPEVLSRVFNPFFTTKESGRGTGLGLPIVRRIAEEHNGSIRVESEPGKGTTFIVSLPIEPHPAEKEKPAEGTEQETGIRNNK